MYTLLLIIAVYLAGTSITAVVLRLLKMKWPDIVQKDAMFVIIYAWPYVLIVGSVVLVGIVFHRLVIRKIL